MPVDRLVGKWNPETKKVEWVFHTDEVPDNPAPAIEGVKEIRAVGLPGQPTFSSRKSYERAVKDAGCVVVGNDPAAMVPDRVRTDLTEPGHARKRRT